MSSYKTWFVLPTDSNSKSLLTVANSIALCALGLVICSASGCSRSPTTAQAQTKPSVDLPIVSTPIATTPNTTARIAASPVARNSNAITAPATNASQAKADKADKADSSPRTTAAQSPAVVTSAKAPQKNTDAKRKNKTFDLTFDDLAFDMEKGSEFKRTMLTPDIKGYDGGTVRLRGYIRPSTKQKGLTKFVFVRDNKECCFGPGAALYDCVLVRMAKGKGANFTVRPVTIEGKFYIKEYLGPDDKTWAVFRMKDGKVK